MPHFLVCRQNARHLADRNVCPTGHAPCAVGWRSSDCVCRLRCRKNWPLPNRLPIITTERDFACRPSHDPLFCSEEISPGRCGCFRCQIWFVPARHAAAARLRAAISRTVGRRVGRRRSDRHGGVGAGLGAELRRPAAAVSDGLPWANRLALPVAGRNVQRIAPGIARGCICSASWPRRGVSARRRRNCATTFTRHFPPVAETFDRTVARRFSASCQCCPRPQSNSTNCWATTCRWESLPT